MEGPQQEGSKLATQVEDDGEEQETLRRAKDDAAKLRATVERLESELNSVKAGAGMGGASMAAVGNAGFGLGVGNGAMQFGAPAAGSPWAAGGMAGGMAGEMCRGLSSLLGCSFVFRMQQTYHVLPRDV